MRQQRLDNKQILLTRYEDLVSKPDEELKKLLQFCELRQDSKFMEYAHSTLQPGRAHKPFNIHESLRPAFETTMRELGY